MSSPLIELRGISKHYGEVRAVHAVDLQVERGSITVFLGPSGCGKTTTLRLIAGIERPDEGEVWLDGVRVSGRGVWVAPEDRRIGMVFQDYALFPHLSVEANIAFGLRGWSRKEQRKQIDAMLDLVGLTGLQARMPHELSGGQQQRVALARALAPAPKVILLDEPFSNLDVALRRKVRTEVKAILQAAHITSIFVTHDQEEALSLSDQVAVMFDGEMAHIGTPQAVYAEPATPEVAAFVGDANFIDGDGQGDSAHTALGTVRLTHPATGKLKLLLRPEALRLCDDGSGLPVTIQQIEYYGHSQRVAVCGDTGKTYLVRVSSMQLLHIGQAKRLEVAEAVYPF